MDRRDFLKESFMAAAKVAVGGSIVAGLLQDDLFAAPTGGKRIGLQLYSVRAMMSHDAVDTLKQVAAIGYKELETADYNSGKIYGMSPKEFRSIVEDLGMKVSSSHLGERITKDNADEVYAWWDKALDAQAEVGCRYAIQPSMEIGDTIDDIKLYADHYNRVGEMAKDRGLLFGFHNHSGEFKVIDGTTVLEYLINNTDPKLVCYQLDVYWAKKGGADPAAFITKYAGRFPLLHIKDEDLIGGTGDLDFKAIFNAAYKQGMKDYYVEVEKPAKNMSIIKTVEKSFDYLYHADYVK